MKIAVFNRDQVQKLSITKPHAFISINDSDQEPASLQINEHTTEVLRLGFDDVYNTEDKNRDIILFDNNFARRILSFHNRHLSYGTDFLLIIHCNGGQCRSPAVAAALEKIMYNDDDVWFRTKRPNSHVYRTILEVYYGGQDV